MGVSLQTFRLRIGSFQQGFNRSCSRSINKRSCKRNLKALLTIIFLINSVLVLTVVLSQYWRHVYLYQIAGVVAAQSLSLHQAQYICVSRQLYLLTKPTFLKGYATSWQECYMGTDLKGDMALNYCIGTRVLHFCIINTRMLKQFLLVTDPMY